MTWPRLVSEWPAEMVLRCVKHASLRTLSSGQLKTFLAPVLLNPETCLQTIKDRRLALVAFLGSLRPDDAIEKN